MSASSFKRRTSTERTEREVGVLLLDDGALLGIEEDVGGATTFGAVGVY
jgi:hypothetical protein